MQGRVLPVPITITVEKLARLSGTPGRPAVVDVRTYQVFLAHQRHVPGSLVRASDRIAEWAPRVRGRSVVVVCEDGRRNSYGDAVWLRSAGIEAEALQGGISEGRRAADGSGR